MALLVMLRAIAPRLLFTAHALTCVWRIAKLEDHRLYWLLLLPVLLLPLELIVTLVLRKGEDYKWVSMAIVLYLINVVPSIWLIEVRYFEVTQNEACPNATNTPVLPHMSENPLPSQFPRVRREVPEKAASSESGFLSSGSDAEEFLFPTTKAPTGRHYKRAQVMTSTPVHASTSYLTSQKFTLFETQPTYVTTSWPELSEVLSLEKKPKIEADLPKTPPATVPTHLSTGDDGLKGKNRTRAQGRDASYILAQVMEVETTVDKLLASSDAWTLFIHQTLLLFLIIGRWLLPTGAEVSREKLSQLLLEFIGTAGDTLEFKTETMQDSAVRCNPPNFYCIMAVWTWSLIQFPLVIKVHKDTSGSEDQVVTRGSRSLLRMYRGDVWTSIISIFIQDGPFLVVRLMLLIRFGLQTEKQMLLFFTIKNVLVLMLQVYRLVVIYGEYQALLSVPPGAAPPHQREMKNPKVGKTGGKKLKESSDEDHGDTDMSGTDHDSFTMTISVSHDKKTHEVDSGLRLSN